MTERVVVVGGGVTGALTSVALAEQGFTVTVLEKADLGNGSSRRSAASLRAQFTMAETVAGMMYAQRYYENFHAILRTPGPVEPVLRQNGYLFLYEDPASTRLAWDREAGTSAKQAWASAVEAAAMQQDLGLPVELLSPAEVSSRWPHLDGGDLAGATWCPTDGFLDPQAIYRRAFARAAELGADVRTGVEVIGARLSRGRITALETTAGPLGADRVVNATNAWADRFSRRVGGMRLKVAPTKRYLYLTGTDNDGFAWDELPMTVFGGGSDRGTFARPVFGRADGARLQTGRAHDALPEPCFTDAHQDRVEPGFHHTEGTNSYGYTVLDQIRDFAPGLAADLRITATECGYYGITPDNNPIIGRDTNLENLVHAVGFSGHGLMHAPFTAALVAAEVTGSAPDGRLVLPEPFEKREIDIRRFAPDRSFAVPEGLVL